MADLGRRANRFRSSP